MKDYRELLKSAGFNLPEKEGSLFYEQKLKEIAEKLELDKGLNFKNTIKKLIETLE